MPNSFAEITCRIAAEFAAARTEPMAGHPLAKAIHYDWPEAAHNLVAVQDQDKYKFSSSAGIETWNAASWLAVLHPDITTTAQAGYYPVYLLSLDLTMCLVMGQGAKKRDETVGRRLTIVELAARAKSLRLASSAWESRDF